MKVLAITFKNIKKFIQNKPLLFAFLVISQIVCTVVVFLVCGFVDNAYRSSKVIEEGQKIFWIDITNNGNGMDAFTAVLGEDGNMCYEDGAGNIYSEEEIDSIEYPEGYYSDICYFKNFKPKTEEFIKILEENFNSFTISGFVDNTVGSQMFISGISSPDNQEVSDEIKEFKNSNENILRISTTDCKSAFGKEPVIGDKVKLGNKEYTISIIDENVAGPNIPYNTIPDNFIVSSMYIYTKEPCTPKESAKIQKKIEELFGTREYEPPEPRVLEELQNIQLAYGVTAAVILMVLLNISRVYSYVLTYRKKSLAVMSICGASKGKIFAIYLTELLLTLVATFGIGLLIFHTLLLHPIASIYPNFLISMTPMTYLTIFGIYFVIASLVMSITISMFIFKSSVEMERSGD